MKKVITNTYALATRPAVSKRFKYIILIIFATISINSAQNNPMDRQNTSAPVAVNNNNNIDSIGRLIEANWDSIDYTRKDIFNELSLLKRKIKNTKRPIIVIADTVYVTDTLVLSRKNFRSIQKLKNE
jgi:hypothetical protein